MANGSASFCEIKYIVFFCISWKIVITHGQIQEANILNTVQYQASSSRGLWPEIRLPQGQLRGRALKTSTGKEYLAFLGIPYAHPPIGSLRFKPSIPLPSWNTLLSASTYKEPCPQYDSRGNELGSEDCLYLNVYTPNLQHQTYGTHFPVMVYIQAESFENGDASLYGPDKLIDKDVVVVTFNYRLGLLGFLSTEDDAASGNFGLHDQRLALDWIKANIDAFSGDPNRVTLFGQGAGASSVILHIISQASQGLFHGAIAQSGSPLCDWSIESNPSRFARDVAESVGCPSSPTQRLVDCLRTISPSALLRAQSKVKIFGEFPQRAAPVIEKPGTGRFITDDPRSLLNRGNFKRIPLIIGTTSHEASYFYPLITDAYYTGESYYHEKELIPRFLESATNFKGLVKEKVIPSILFQYFNGVDLLNITSVATRFINMSSDALYNSCVDETIKLYWFSRAAVYHYVYEYKGENSMVNLLLNNVPTLFNTGVCHGDDLFSLFSLRINGLKPPSFSDNKVSNRLVTLWTDFAKYGLAPKIVNYDYPKWEKWDPERQTYLKMGSSLSIGRGYRQREVLFWTQSLRNSSLAAGLSSSLTSARSPMYQTLAWAMVAVSISLLVLVIVLLSILYMQRKSQSFHANENHHDNTSSHFSTGSTLY